MPNEDEQSTAPFSEDNLPFLVPDFALATQVLGLRLLATRIRVLEPHFQFPFLILRFSRADFNLAALVGHTYISGYLIEHVDRYRSDQIIHISISIRDTDLSINDYIDIYYDTLVCIGRVQPGDSILARYDAAEDIHFSLQPEDSRRRQ
jgi:hypothetical protein